jgi:hypothetical protein
MFLSNDFIVLFLANWLGSTLGETPLSERVKNIATGPDLPKPRLHASLLP